MFGKVKREDPRLNFKMIHENYNVSDLQRSLAFYEGAGPTEVCRKVAADGSISSCMWRMPKAALSWSSPGCATTPGVYDLGECEFHLAFRRMTTKPPIKSTPPWAASALKIRLWAFISSRTRTGYWLGNRTPRND